MTLVPATLHLHAQALQQRRAQLQGLLQGAVTTATTAPDVSDFKDVAAVDARALVDDTQQAHAAAELEQVVAALQRIAAGTYGSCLDCGEPIAERRLLALPATRFCRACQDARERESQLHR